MNQIIIDKEERQKKEIKYNETVTENLKNIKNEEYDKYMDPDKSAHYECIVDGLTINLAQDGLCSFNQIKECSTNFWYDYKLIREYMFDCLVWPVYAMSINQMRYAKYRDRLDLTLIDIQRFYSIVKPNTEITSGIAKIIFNKCELGRSYIFPHTFYWLRSFKNYNNFIKERKLEDFVSKDGNGNFIAKKWTNDDTEYFDKNYYKALLERVKTYKSNRTSNL